MNQPAGGGRRFWSSLLEDPEQLVEHQLNILRENRNGRPEPRDPLKYHVHRQLKLRERKGIL